MSNQNTERIDASDIENVIDLLDDKCNEGLSRIKLLVEDGDGTGQVSEQYHHGRCDVGSVWATGKIPNFDCE